MFAYYVSDPSQYGVVKFDEQDKPDRNRRKANTVSIQLGSNRTLFLRQLRARHCGGLAALGARRTGDHRCQSALSGAQASCTL